MTQVEQTQEHGYTVYKFTANNTSYEVLTQDGVEFQVWSKRQSRAGHATLTCYDSLIEMAQRSKALNHLAILIAA